MVLHHITGIEFKGMWFDLLQERETGKVYLTVQQYNGVGDMVIVEADPEFLENVNLSKKGETDGKAS